MEGKKTKRKPQMSLMIESRKHRASQKLLQEKIIDPIVILDDDDSLGVILDPDDVNRVLFTEEREGILGQKKTLPKKIRPVGKKTNETKKRTPRKTLSTQISPPVPSSPNINLNCLLSEEERTKEHTFSFSIRHLNSLEHKKKMLETPEKRSKVSFKDKLLCKNRFILTKYNEDYSIDYSDVITKIATVLRKLSRLSYNEIENGLYNLSEFDLSFTKEIDGIIAIIGVDPAPLTCGLCLYSFVDGFVEIGIHAFRQRQHVPDIGCVDLCEVVRKFIKIIDCNCIMWAIENQIAALKKENNILVNPNLSEMQKESYYLEQYAVQFFFTALIPRDRLCIVSPSALKTFFGFETQLDKSKQYEYNKETAVKLGKACTKDYIKKRIIELTGREDPNIYDAILVARYVYETLGGIPSFSKKKKLDEREKKKKRKTEVVFSGKKRHMTDD